MLGAIHSPSRLRAPTLGSRAAAVALTSSLVLESEPTHATAAAATLVAMLVFGTMTAGNASNTTLMEGTIPKQAILEVASHKKHQVCLALSPWGRRKKETSSRTTAKKKQLPRPEQVPSMPHRDVTVWQKEDDGRTLFLLGALNHSAPSADLAAALVKEIQPDAVFLDINKEVFTDFGIAKRVEGRLRSSHSDHDNNEDVDNALKDDTDFWEKLVFRPIESEEELAEIPDLAAKGMMASFDDPVDKSVKGIFGQLRYAGLKRGDERVASWTHYVSAIEQGHKANATIVLGGRDATFSKQRSEEAISKTNRKAASELVYNVRPNWKAGLTPRQNLTVIRDLIEQQIPSFYQVMFAEADAHTALQIDKLTESSFIVAVFMMIHISGVEEELERKGWKRVETW